MEIVKELLGNYAFPIVCCLLMFYYCFSTQKEQNKIVQANTEAINKLIDKIETLGENIRKE